MAEAKKRQKSANILRHSHVALRTIFGVIFSGMFFALSEAPCGATLSRCRCHMQNVANFIGIGSGIEWALRTCQPPVCAPSLPRSLPLVFMLTRHFAVNIFSFAGWDFRHFMRPMRVNACKYFYWIFAATLSAQICLRAALPAPAASSQIENQII